MLPEADIPKDLKRNCTWTYQTQLRLRFEELHFNF